MLLKAGRYRALDDVIVEQCLSPGEGGIPCVSSERRVACGEEFEIPETNDRWYYRISEDAGAAEWLAAHGLGHPAAQRVEAIPSPSPAEAR